jgi:hypothetical protein
VSLQQGKVYAQLRDEDAQSEGLVRVVDDSGEDYLFPAENIVSTHLSAPGRRPATRD